MSIRLILQGLYFLAHLGVLGVFVLGLSARYVHPAIAWWPQPLAIGLPVVAGVLGLFAIADATTQRWVLFGITMAALLVFASRYASALTTDGVESGNGLTVVTFNSGGVEHTKPDSRWVRRLLVELTPDLACLQEFGVGRRGSEARANAGVQSILDSLGYEIVAPEVPTGHRGPPPIFSRLPLEESSAIGLSTTHGVGPAGTVIRGQFSRNGRSFVVYNVHLQSFSRRRPWEDGDTFNPKAWIRFIRRTSSAFIQRATEARDIRQMVEREELPTLLCGDFNSTPHQWTYRRLAEDLRDAFRTQGGIWGPTFPARFPVFRIDYILASDHWLVDDVAVGPQLPPDHRPVVARLHLRPVE